MNQIYVLKHKTLPCAYIRSIDDKVDIKSKPSVIFTPLRNCLTQHITSKASDERRRIYNYLKENNLFLEGSKLRARGWSDDWEAFPWHQDIDGTEKLIELFDALDAELKAQGFTVLNSRVAR